MKIHKPTKKELNNHSKTRSDYCKKAAIARLKLCRLKQIVNRYLKSGVTYNSIGYKEKKDKYLNKYFYFEINTHKIVSNAPKSRYAYGNILFTDKELSEKAKELAKKS